MSEFHLLETLAAIAVRENFDILYRDPVEARRWAELVEAQKAHNLQNANNATATESSRVNSNDTTAAASPNDASTSESSAAVGNVSVETKTGVETLRASDYQLLVDREPDKDDHSNCTHGVISREHGYEFLCEVPRGCPHQIQKTASESRKCISNFFGRNKTCALAIARPITWCRSHYQTNAYQCQRWNFGKLALIWEQMSRIEEDNPGTQYCAVLKLEEAKRLDNWAKEHDDLPEVSRSSFKTKSAINNRGKGYRSELWVLVHIQRNFLGQHKTQTDCKEFLDWVLEKLRLPPTHPQHLNHVPQIEFLPEFAETPSFDKLHVAQKNGVERNAAGNIDFVAFERLSPEQGQILNAVSTKRRNDNDEVLEEPPTKRGRVAPAGSDGFRAINTSSVNNDVQEVSGVVKKAAQNVETNYSSCEDDQSSVDLARWQAGAKHRRMREAFHHALRLLQALQRVQLDYPAASVAWEAAVSTLEAMRTLPIGPETEAKIRMVLRIAKDEMFVFVPKNPEDYDSGDYH